MTSVKGLGASLGVAIGSSFVYENEIDFDKEAILTHVEAVSYTHLTLPTKA